MVFQNAVAHFVDHDFQQVDYGWLACHAMNARVRMSSLSLSRLLSEAAACSENIQAVSRTLQAWWFGCCSSEELCVRVAAMISARVAVQPFLLTECMSCRIVLKVAAASPAAPQAFMMAAALVRPCIHLESYWAWLSCYLAAKQG